MISRRVRTSKDDQVPLGRPPAGRHPNTGESRDGGESVIADTHEAGGQDAGLHLEGRVKHVTDSQGKVVSKAVDVDEDKLERWEIKAE